MLSNVHAELATAAGQAAYEIYWPFTVWDDPEGNLDTAAARIMYRLYSPVAYSALYSGLPIPPDDVYGTPEEQQRHHEYDASGGAGYDGPEEAEHYPEFDDCLVHASAIA